MPYNKQFQLHAGRLRHRVTIQGYTETRDAVGTKVKTWTNLACVPKVWGMVLPLSSREIVEGDQTDSRITHRIIIRHRDDINHTTRFLFKNRVFNVESVLNVEERDKLLIVLCSEDD